MARLIPGTERYAEVFGAVQEVASFTSELPEYYAITQAWADPSIRLDLGLDRADGMFSKIARDVQAGGRRMVWAMSVPGAANMPLALFSGVRELIFSQPIVQQLPVQQVTQIFDPKNRPPGVPGVAGVLIGAALAAAGMAVPIVGQIAGALVAFGTALHSAINKNKIAKDLNDEKVRQELYKSFPPLQVADSATDSQIVRRIHALVETGDITDIFMPRFKGEWVGIERAKGFAFAPGETQKASDVFGEDQQQFVAAGGIGLIPGTGIVTSVIQVSLDPQSQEFKIFMGASHPDPRTSHGGHERVIDTGTFYKATSDQATLVWSMATEDRGLQGNPMLYRMDVRRMADAWQQYFEGGLEYIKRVAFPWWGSVVAGDGSIDKNANLEGFFAPAVFYGVGVWAGLISGGTTLHPIWEVYAPPSGYYRDGMKRKKLYPLSELAGAFLPIMDIPKPGFQQSMGTQWDRGPNVKAVCEGLRAQQDHDLAETLIAMYVRRTDAAFAKDPGFGKKLDDRRRALLTAKGEEAVRLRTRIVWPDIPEDEQLDGLALRDAALKAGVPQVPTMQSAAGLNRGTRPRPKLPDFQPPLLGAPQSGFGAAAGVAAFGSLLAMGTLAYRLRRRSRSYAGF